jgi:quercetin dioxygenase-like cupin family protein
MPAQSVVVAPSDRPQALKVVGEGITVLADGATTGSYEIFLQAGPEGSGPPPHNHPWDEAFYVIAGQVTFGIEDDQDLAAPPGTLVHIPGGSTHWFRFGPGGGQMISMTSRAGAAAFFAEVDREISPTEPDFGDLLRVASSHGLTVPLPANQQPGSGT